MTEVLELSDKDFRTTVVKVLQGGIMGILEIKKEIESLSKEIKDLSFKNKLKF